MHLADLKAAEKGTKKDPAGAHALYQKACDENPGAFADARLKAAPGAPAQPPKAKAKPKT